MQLANTEYHLVPLILFLIRLVISDLIASNEV